MKLWKRKIVKNKFVALKTYIICAKIFIYQIISLCQKLDMTNWIFFFFWYDILRGQGKLLLMKSSGSSATVAAIASLENIVLYSLPQLLLWSSPAPLTYNRRTYCLPWLADIIRKEIETFYDIWTTHTVH